MHKPLRHPLTVFDNKKVLLFVLLFFVAGTAYFFTQPNGRTLLPNLPYNLQPLADKNVITILLFALGSVVPAASVWGSFLPQLRKCNHADEVSGQNDYPSNDSEMFNKGILDTLDTQIAVINASGMIVKVNKAWRNFSQHRMSLPNANEGANYFEVFKNTVACGEDDFAKMEQGVRNIFDGSSNKFSIEFMTNLSKGDRWFSLQATKFDSIETLVVLEHSDISERKIQEDKMLRAVEQYDILSKATSDTIWDWNIPGNQVTYNSGISKMFGYEVSEVENAVQWWRKNIHPDDLQRVMDSLSELFKNRTQNLQLEYRFRCSEGNYKQILDRGLILYDANGGPTRVMGIMQDVTYEKEEATRIAKTVINAQEQERSYIGQELHDNINQILAASLLTVAMMKQKSVSAERVGELIEICESHLVHAIEEIRKLSHRLAPAFFEETTLKSIFEDLLMNVNLNDRYRIHFSFDDVINVLANEDIQINLYRILQEEFKNILKYAAATEVSIRVSLADDAIIMQTRDNGRGFDPATIKKGIGLANIKKRVEAFSGRFSLNTAPGEGCEIIVEIPLNTA